MPRKEIPRHERATDVYVDCPNGHAVADQMITLCPQLRVLFISGCSRDHLVGNGVRRGSDPTLAERFRQIPFCGVWATFCMAGTKPEPWNGRSHGSSGDVHKTRV